MAEVSADADSAVCARSGDFYGEFDLNLSQGPFPVVHRIELQRVYMGWLTPTAFKQGDAELDVTAQILAGGKSSRLYKKLVYEQQIAPNLSIGLRTVSRIRQRFVTEGFLAALDHRPQPPRPDKIKIKGDVEQELVRIACTDPPEGYCHWTLQLLADELVALGQLKEVSTETVRLALKKTTSSRGSWKPGASRRTPMASTSGAWRT